jgi:hypothetical protein
MLPSRAGAFNYGSHMAISVEAQQPYDLLVGPDPPYEAIVARLTQAAVIRACKPHHDDDGMSSR